MGSSIVDTQPSEIPLLLEGVKQNHQAARVDHLEAAGGCIDHDSIAWLRPTPHNTPLEEKRRRYEEDGYVWLKNVIPRERVLECRSQYFKYLAPTGVLKEGTDPVDGIYVGGPPEHWLWPSPARTKAFPDGEPHQDFLDRIVAAHTQPFYLDFANCPEIKQAVEELMDWDDSVQLKRGLLRLNVPGGESTVVHYDQVFLRKVGPTSITAWVPIGDISARSGGLMYLEDSVRLGAALEQRFGEIADKSHPTEKTSGFNKSMMTGGGLARESNAFGKLWQRRWLIADYEAGDIVLHKPHNIHSSATNTDEQGRIRLSTDLRYYQANTPYDDRWMSAWYIGDSL